MNKYYVIHWLSVVSVVMWSHLTKTCIVGFCSDELYQKYEQDLASGIFVFSLACLFAEFQLCGEFIKFLPLGLRLILDVGLFLLLSNICLRLLWIPFSMSIFEFIVLVEDSNFAGSFHWFFLDILQHAHHFVTITTALLCFGFYLHSAEVIQSVKGVIDDFIKDFWKKKSRVSFSIPLDNTALKSKYTSKSATSPVNTFGPNH